jgi:hypothetical protein
LASIPGSATAHGTLERVVTRLPYVIVYEVSEADDEIVVLGILSRRADQAGAGNVATVARNP